MVARLAHNQKVAGSSPASAIPSTVRSGNRTMGVASSNSDRTPGVTDHVEEATPPPPLKVVEAYSPPAKPPLLPKILLPPKKV